MYRIHSKRIYSGVSPDDGYRILVDRLWSRGLSKDKAQVDIWIKEVAPSADLRKSFHSGAISFDEFRDAYLAELQTNINANVLVGLCSDVLQSKNITLLYAAKNDRENNAVVLEEWLLKQI